MAAPWGVFHDSRRALVFVGDRVAWPSVVATITVGNRPLEVAVSPDGSRAYVANQSSGNVSVIDTAADSVVATIAVGLNPYGVAVSPDGSRAYVANQSSGNVSVIGL